MSGLHVLKGPRVPETTGHPFLCEHFRGTLTGGECLRRQTSRVKAGALARDQTPRVPQHLQFCASGTCEQGAAIAEKFPDWKPEDRPLPSWTTQMAAKRKATAELPPMRGLAVRPAPVEPIEQLKRECADIVLSMKKPSWQEFKAQKDRVRAEEPPPEPVEREPHPLSNRGLEGAMAEKTCAEPGCSRPAKTAGLCGMHYQRDLRTRKNTKRGVAEKPEEGKMAEAKVEQPRRTCDEPGCTLALRSDNKTGKCKVHARQVHHQAYLARKNGKPLASPGPRGKPSLTGQDEFDLMIRIRDEFRKLSADGQRYVLAALKG